MNTKKRKLDAKIIIEIVSDYFQTDVTKNLNTRRRDIVEPRQMAMYFLREHTNNSLDKIGRLFKKDHATALHAEKKIRNLIKYDHFIRESYVAIDQRIKMMYPYIDADLELDHESMVDAYKRVKSLNIKLINRAIYLKSKFDNLPDYYKKQLFHDDEYFYPTQQKDSGVGVVHES